MKSRSGYRLGAFLLLLALPARAGTGQWTSSGPEGASILRVAADATGTLYACESR